MFKEHQVAKKTQKNSKHVADLISSAKVARPAILRRIRALGYGVLEEGREAGWFAEHRELILSGVAGLLLLFGWLAGLAGVPRALSLGLLLGAYAAGGFYTLRDAW